MSKNNKYQVFVDLYSDVDMNNENVICDSFVVKSESAADAEGAAWSHIERSGLYKEYREIYLWDITEDDKVE